MVAGANSVACLPHHRPSCPRACDGMFPIQSSKVLIDALFWKIKVLKHCLLIQVNSAVLTI